MIVWTIIWLTCLFGTIVVFTWLSVVVSIKGYGELKQLFEHLKEGEED
ncbi:hypothetical protein ACFLT7_03925 [candidate division KSB1 bacterium]